MKQSVTGWILTGRRNVGGVVERCWVQRKEVLNIKTGTHVLTLTSNSIKLRSFCTGGCTPALSIVRYSLRSTLKNSNPNQAEYITRPIAVRWGERGGSFGQGFVVTQSGSFIRTADFKEQRTALDTLLLIGFGNTNVCHDSPGPGAVTSCIRWPHWQWKNPIVPSWTGQTESSSSVTFQHLFWRHLPFPKVFSGLLPRWICEITFPETCHLECHTRSMD